MIMSNEPKKIENVEQLVESLIEAYPIKSLTVINDVAAGEIVGGVGDVDHTQELAQGVVYVVIGLGKLPTGYDAGINFIDIPKRKRNHATNP